MEKQCQDKGEKEEEEREEEEERRRRRRKERKRRKDLDKSEEKGKDKGKDKDKDKDKDKNKNKVKQVSTLGRIMSVRIVGDGPYFAQPIPRASRQEGPVTAPTEVKKRQEVMKQKRIEQNDIRCDEIEQSRIE